MTETTVKTATAKERLGISVLRLQLGATLQKHRVARGMTQSELAEYSHLSLKYVGEIERGEANTTLEVLERLARAVGWNPMDSLEGMNEPLSEGVRILLLDEVQQMVDRLRNMAKWLHALNPALQPQLPPAPPAPPKDAADTKEGTEAAEAKPAQEEPPRRVRGPRPSALERKQRKEAKARAEARANEGQTKDAPTEGTQTRGEQTQEAQPQEPRLQGPGAEARAPVEAEAPSQPESPSPPAPESSE